MNESLVVLAMDRCELDVIEVAFLPRTGPESEFVLLVVISMLPAAKDGV